MIDLQPHRTCNRLRIPPREHRLRRCGMDHEHEPDLANVFEDPLFVWRDGTLALLLDVPCNLSMSAAQACVDVGLEKNDP